MNYYTISPKLYARLVYNIKTSSDFRKDIQYGLVKHKGRVLLNQCGINTCEAYNLPHTELAEIVSV